MSLDINRWAATINFGNDTAAKHCLTALTRKVNQEISFSQDANGMVCLEGQFDFNEFEEEFHKIVAEHIQGEERFAIKAVFVDADGYFGGWSETYTHKGELLEGVSVNELYERNFT